MHLQLCTLKEALSLFSGCLSTGKAAAASDICAMASSMDLASRNEHLYSYSLHSPFSHTPPLSKPGSFSSFPPPLFLLLLIFSPNQFGFRLYQNHAHQPNSEQILSDRPERSQNQSKCISSRITSSVKVKYLSTFSPLVFKHHLNIAYNKA